ncbi:glycoside hydrolase family 1 protein [Tellurirhabdus bombi]|uniref:amine oxidase n=1 Tax=Tellurirhabdus bombi TaxID=2907205 RepID=UPI001F42EE57|nr:amine oxidase [Tellurirhabdus bombi]
MLATRSIQHTSPNPFRSFWMGGYECTDQQNCFGIRVDLAKTTGHLDMLDEDYQNLHPFGIHTVREGIRWSEVEKKAYQYDWSTVKLMLEKGRTHGIQQVWDLCHFGYPDDLTPLHPMFARRFAALCRAFVSFYRSVNPDGVLIVTPINEVSFISWLGGDVRGTSPYCVGQGWDVKYHLMRAYIEGVAALREADPTICIMSTEPLVNMVPPLKGTPQDISRAKKAHNAQYQAMDILTGRACPELGGSPDYVDIIGVNFYYNNQWVVEPNKPHHFLPWANEGNDPRWRPLRSLFQEVYERYGKPIVLSETSHPGEDRPHWIRYVASECAATLRRGLPLWGICLYPIIDRPDWDNLDHWHRSGLWDAELGEGLPPKRILSESYAQALLESQVVVRETGLSHQVSAGIRV